jgi:hypothetical protein
MPLGAGGSAALMLRIYFYRLWTISRNFFAIRGFLDQRHSGRWRHAGDPPQ